MSKVLQIPHKKYNYAALAQRAIECYPVVMHDPIQIFQQYISEHGLKNTPQRLRIVESFLSAKGHISTEELYATVKTLDPSVGQATVYRTMKLLCESGLAREVQFGDGVSRYEQRIGAEHHDHLICEHCGLTIEVVDEDIERLQEALARRNGFAPTRHHLYLYGICPECAAKSK